MNRASKYLSAISELFDFDIDSPYLDYPFRPTRRRKHVDSVKPTVIEITSTENYIPKGKQNKKLTRKQRKAKRKVK